MEIRKTEEKDIPAVMEVIADAKASLKARNIPQWQNGYPNPDSIRNDIGDGVSWVLEDEGRIIGTCCIRLERDPNYTLIENGEWLNDEEYAVIHRIAVLSAEKGKGYAGRFFSLAEQLALAGGRNDLRADTHDRNKAMRKALESFGFRACGRVYMADGAPRIGYHKVICP